MCSRRGSRRWTSTLRLSCAPRRSKPAIPGPMLRGPDGDTLDLDAIDAALDDPARFFLDHARVALSDGGPFGPGCEHFVRLNFATSRALLEQIVGATGDAVRRRGVAG